MNPDTVILALRLITAAALLAFLGALFALLWRDFRAVAGASLERPRGKLIVIAVGETIEDLAAEMPGALPRDTDEGLSAWVGAAAPLVGAVFPLLPLTTLGRAPTNTVVLQDAFCSQEHAVIARRGRQWWLEDRRSSNGTRLNGEPITEPVVLSSGDTIGMGRILFRVELE